MIDCSHANSGKDPTRQSEVAADVARRVASGDHGIFGLMLESFLISGRQDHAPGKSLSYGQSITDACLGWDETEPVLAKLAESVRARRVGAPSTR
jgi:3-deoxy-7-phosphoheptulonate synthase